MNYERINYDELKRLKQINYHFFLIGLIILGILIFIFCIFIHVSKEAKFYGYYDNDELVINVDNKLSDYIKKNHQLKFKDTYYEYRVKSFKEYNLVDNVVYEKMSLAVEGPLNGEIGEVTIFYDNVRLIKFILDLFK